MVLYAEVNDSLLPHVQSATMPKLHGLPASVDLTGVAPASVCLEVGVAAVPGLFSLPCSLKNLLCSMVRHAHSRSHWGTHLLPLGIPPVISLQVDMQCTKDPYSWPKGLIGFMSGR